jgi:CRISPR-associated protein Cmx8
MADELVNLTFDSFALPTVQHRAGLAGLLMLVDSMRRRKIKNLPEISIAPDSIVRVSLTRKSLASTFNELYDASTEERESPRKWSGKKPLRVEEKRPDPKTGKLKTVFIYPQTVPKARYLKGFGMPQPWLKLWRDAVWETLRGIYKTRAPYEQRAAGKTVSEAETTWRDLQKFQQARTRNEIHIVKIASSLFIGAQAANAERVPFRGRADEVFLLHFWPVVMGVYVPQVIDREGARQFTGAYVIVVPDVSDLEGFVQEFPKTIAQLKPDLAGYRPKEAVVSIPQEGGLEYLHHLTRLAKGKAEQGELAHSTSGVEIYHVEKQGNSIHTLSVDRVSATLSLLEKYEAIRERYSDPLFKRQAILNLLRDKSWYVGFDQLFSTNDHERFVGTKAQWFSTDTRTAFDANQVKGVRP